MLSTHTVKDYYALAKFCHPATSPPSRRYRCALAKWRVGHDHCNTLLHTDLLSKVNGIIIFIIITVEPFIYFDNVALFIIGIILFDLLYSMFFRAFAKLRKATNSFVMSVRLSVRPRGTIRHPQDGLTRHLIFQHFPKICPEFPVSLKSYMNNEYFT